MFFPEAGLQIWLYSQPTDMRKSYHGLSALVKNQLQENPLSGQLFVFINRRRTQIKVLYFDRSGYCIWMKDWTVSLSTQKQGRNNRHLPTSTSCEREPGWG